MRQSQIFAKTKKSSKEFDSINATLLIKGGFVDQVMAGVYTFLPLGLRVLNKIENIVREEMDKVGSEVLMPTLAPIENWQTTGRFESMDVLLKAGPAYLTAKSVDSQEYVVSPTHEETITPLAKKFVTSYKELPFGVYQIQTKFRNETRPKSGLMRGREFRMKDLYSFHKDEADLDKYFGVVHKAYDAIYKRLGLDEDTFYTAASGGDFCDDYSYEFQTKIENGEDTVFYDKKTGEAFNKEVAPAKAVTPKQDSKQKPMEAVYGENIVGVDDLCKFLNLRANQTSKTLIYETDTGPVAVSVRGDYDVNEYKLKKVAKVKWLKLASEAVVKKVTGSKIGYAGIIGLPADVKVFIDESLKDLVNFETGGNKENYHNSNVNWDRDISRPKTYYDVKMAKSGDLNPETGTEYEVFKASEVGNIFKLNTKFSKAFDYKYTDADGTQKIIYMGCYGLGTSRVMGVLVEKFCDASGIIWPESVAPFRVHLLGLNLENNAVKTRAEEIYELLQKAGVEVLFDDRENTSAGEKFSDADLIGIPNRLVVSEKSGDHIEFKKRNEKTSVLLSPDELLKNF